MNSRACEVSIAVQLQTMMGPNRIVGFGKYPARLCDSRELAGQRPEALADGAWLTTPMPVIMVGVIGGALAYGIVGLFFGPIVLAVSWAVMAAWMQGGDSCPGEDR